VGLICNLMVRPVAERHFKSEAELAAERAKAHEVAAPAGVGGTAPGAAGRVSPLVVALAWLAVGIPLLWGIWTTLAKALPLFRID
jgi:hypothetical protein